MRLVEYNDIVLDYLEYLEYQHYVQWFDPATIAEAIAKTAVIFMKDGISPRMCALSIFGLTWEYQLTAVNPNKRVM